MKNPNFTSHFSKSSPKISKIQIKSLTHAQSHSTQAAQLVRGSAVFGSSERNNIFGGKFMTVSVQTMNTLGIALVAYRPSLIYQ